MHRRKFLQQLMLYCGGISSPGVVQAMLNDVSQVARSTSLLSAQQAKICSIASELIIPETDTPGAIAAGVPAFIEQMVSHWYTANEREIFFSGIDTMNHFCATQFAKDFINSNAAQQTAAIEEMQGQAASYTPPAQSFGFKANVDEASPFFLKLRELTVVGYYSSEVGATQEHLYDPMPMDYNGDASLAESGRQRRT